MVYVNVLDTEKGRDKILFKVERINLAEYNLMTTGLHSNQFPPRDNKNSFTLKNDYAKFVASYILRAE